MKTNNNNFRSRIMFIFLLLSSPIIGAYAQDTLNTEAKLTSTKLQLIEYNQKILEARLELLETNLKTLKKLEPVAESKKENKTVIDTTTYKEFKQAITFNISRIFEGTFQLNYERIIKKNLSFDVGLIGTYVTNEGVGGNYFDKQELVFSDMGNYTNYYGRMMSGVGISIRLKNYLMASVNSKSKALIGLYAAPQLMYRKLYIIGNQYGYYFNGPSQYKRVIQNLDVYQAGLILGNKFVINKVLCLDVYIGGVMRFSKYSNEKKITEYKSWKNIDYSGILPTVGINIGIFK